MKETDDQEVYSSGPYQNLPKEVTNKVANSADGIDLAKIIEDRNSVFSVTA